MKPLCDSPGHISRRVRLVRNVAAHVAESAASWDLPQIAHIDEVSKYREVSGANFYTSQLLRSVKSLVYATDSKKEEIDQV